MTPTNLTKAIDDYLGRPLKQKERRELEKTRFVEAVVNFFKTDGINRLVKKRGRIDLIVLKTAYSKHTDYELFYDTRGLVEEIKGSKAKVYGPPSVKAWYDAIPYDGEFQYHGHFKPTKEKFVKDLEYKVRCMIK